MVHREREQREREREQLERQQLERQREQQHHPVQSHTGSIPLHQPVASKVPNSIHGPNGLLSNLGSNPPNGPQGAMQPSGAPGGLYGSQMQHGEGTPRTYMQHPAGPPGQPMMFNGSGGPIPGNVAALAQGQQPILNVCTLFFFLCILWTYLPFTSGWPTEPQHMQLALQAPSLLPSPFFFYFFIFFNLKWHLVQKLLILTASSGCA